MTVNRAFILMGLQNTKAIKPAKGFTIVELLIVIVVIGVLAAIVIVAYNGVTNRARTAKSSQAAAVVQKKIEAYNSEVGSYPATFSALTSAATTLSYYMSASQLTIVFAAIAAAPGTGSEATVNYVPACTVVTGYAIGYWDYTTSSQKRLYGNGATSGSTCTTYAAS